jgi:branched-chain amino acid transport system substrate-binding protein
METNKLKTLAVVYDDMPWSRFISRLLHARWDKPGSPVKIVFEVFHASGKTELKAEYTQAMSANPDLIALGEWMGKSANASIQATADLGYKGVRFAFSGTANSRMLHGLGPAADGVMLAANFLPDPNVPENAAYVKAYASQVDDQITNEGVMAYDAVNVLLKAMDKAGTDTDTRKIADAVFNSDYILLAGKCPAKFDKYGHIQRPGQYIGTVRDGKMADVSYFTYPNDIEKEDLALYGKELPPGIYAP